MVSSRNITKYFVWLGLHTCAGTPVASPELKLSDDRALSNLNPFAVTIVQHGTNHTAGHQHQSAICVYDMLSDRRSVQCAVSSATLCLLPYGVLVTLDTLMFLFSCQAS